MLKRAFRRVIEILDDFATLRQTLRDIGMWAPLMAVLTALATWFLATAEQLPVTTRVVLVFAVVCVFVVLMLALRLWTLIRPRAIPDDLMRPHISHRHFRLGDMVPPDRIIRNRTFENCTIYGPAMLHLTGGYGALSQCSFSGSAAEHIVVVVKPGQLLLGVIVLDECVLKGCRLVDISLVGTEELVQQVAKTLVVRG